MRSAFAQVQRAIDFVEAHLAEELPLDVGALQARFERKIMQPRIVQLPAFHVVGLSGHLTLSTNTRIPELWARFVPRVFEISNRIASHTLGLCVKADPATGDEAGFTCRTRSNSSGDAGCRPLDYATSPHWISSATGSGEIDLYVPIASA